MISFCHAKLCSVNFVSLGCLWSTLICCFVCTFCCSFSLSNNCQLIAPLCFIFCRRSRSTWTALHHVLYLSIAQPFLGTSKECPPFSGAQLHHPHKVIRNEWELVRTSADCSEKIHSDKLTNTYTNTFCLSLPSSSSSSESARTATGTLQALQRSPIGPSIWSTNCSPLQSTRSASLPSTPLAPRRPAKNPTTRWLTVKVSASSNGANYHHWHFHHSLPQHLMACRLAFVWSIRRPLVYASSGIPLRRAPFTESFSGIVSATGKTWTMLTFFRREKLPSVILRER